MTICALFVRVAELGTLSSAARERDGCEPDIIEIDEPVGGALRCAALRRTTLSLTAEGEVFLATAAALHRRWTNSMAN